ncbi:hypothetical protein AC249_AIPGENE22091 [Exaiptasia diaphana]|nr:hypothetical protein AC249_AIPGENE22091 [Exaiptasia diaphana]
MNSREQRKGPFMFSNVGTKKACLAEKRKFEEETQCAKRKETLKNDDLFISFQSFKMRKKKTRGVRRKRKKKRRGEEEEEEEKKG